MTRTLMAELTHLIEHELDVVEIACEVGHYDDIELLVERDVLGWHGVELDLGVRDFGLRDELIAEVDAHTTAGRELGYGLARGTSYLDDALGVVEVERYEVGYLIPVVGAAATILSPVVCRITEILQFVVGHCESSVRF